MATDKPEPISKAKTKSDTKGTAPARTEAKLIKAEDPDKVLAIVGLVLAFFIPLAGLIVSIIAYFKSKKAGFKNTVAVIGIIVNTILNLLIISIIVMMVAFGFWVFGVLSQATERDNARKATMQYLGLEIERYTQVNLKLPNDLQDLTTLSGFNNTTLKDSSNNNFSYLAIPKGCDVKTTCTGYIISIPAEVIKNGQEVLEYSNGISL